MVRVTVNNEEAAAAVPAHRRGTGEARDPRADHRRLPLQRPPAAEEVSRLRRGRWPSTASIPATSRIGRKDDDNFRTMVECAVENQKPVRIGVNWGSLDQALLTRMMDENTQAGRAAARARSDDGSDGGERAGLGQGGRALRAAATTRSSCRPRSRGVRDLIDVYTNLAARCDYALHLGLTEAGMGAKGADRLDRGPGSAAAGRHRRHHSREPHAQAGRRPHGRSAGGAADSAVAGDPQLHAAGDELPGLRPHHQHLLPGAGRADPELPARRQMPEWRRNIPAWKS